jgi:hypothetical protein
MKSIFIVALVALTFGSFAKAESCSRISYVAGQSEENNPVLRHVFGYLYTQEGAAIVEKMQAAVDGGNCVSIAVVNPDFSVATVHRMARGSRTNNDEPVAGILDIYKVDNKKPGCEKIDNEATFWQCAETNSSVFVGSGQNVSRAIRDSRDVVISTLTTSPSTLKNIIESANLSDQLKRVNASLITMGGANEAPVLVLQANKYKPSLFSPTLWYNSRRANLESLKTVQALLFLDSKDKAFVDINLRTDRKGSGIVDRKTFVKPKWGTLVGYDLNDYIQSAMEQEGYSYELSWKQDSPSTQIAPR